MKRVLTCLFIFILLLSTGCKDSFKYVLIAKGNVEHIEITGGGFANPSKRILYLDDGYVCIFGVYEHENIRIGDYIYVYHRDWDGKIMRHKPIQELEKNGSS